MNRNPNSNPWLARWAAGLLALGLAACGGGDPAQSTPAAAVDVTVTGISTGTAGLSAATALKITVTKVTVAGRPSVDFTVTNQADQGMTGLVTTDLRFNVAKLVPGAGGGPADWQNYINRGIDGAVQGAQERAGAGFPFGTLVSHGGGSYTYTFATDITNASAGACPAPCTDAAGKPLDLRFEPRLTHRVAIQQGNSAYVPASGIFDFVPDGSAMPTQREVVATDTCNSCHVELKAHGTAVDTKLCVTCHNPGSWVAGTPGVSVDFKVMVHRIHYNRAGLPLPSVAAGSPYLIGSADFSRVVFTQDSRHCVRCHSATTGNSVVATAQGDHWRSQPSINACGSCHDNVYFGSAPDASRPYQTRAHSGGAMTDDSTCATCHAPGKFSDSKDVALAHSFPNRLKAAAARFQYKILGVTGTTPGARPVVTFSVTDPTQGDAAYSITTSPAFTAGAASTLTVKLGWTTKDFGNEGSGQAFGQPISINALTSAVPGAAAGTYTVTSPVALPAGLSGTLRATIEGHPAGDVSTAGVFTDRLAVKSVFKDAAVSGSVVARRSVVDMAKCNVCHDVLSLHGNNRSDEVGVCSVCHNGNATDAARRPATGTVDGKAEEAIDFKTLIHGLHAGQSGQGGMRTKGLVVYGFGGSVNDYSGVVFPGRLSDCTTCHAGNSYQLAGVWAAPTASGILGTTVASGASSTDAADNLRISPTAAVCSSCHDSVPARAHMENPPNGGSFSSTQAALGSAAGETCVLCHGAGKVFDVKTLHGVK
ncbi:MAG: OmcA/MtrC family decaheme c-type cytochrome [Rubrivivax sp.]|nr:OmcA/MtrC family decaheme c-type cytochrome [Rubrivivax sp.]